MAAIRSGRLDWFEIDSRMNGSQLSLTVRPKRRYWLFPSFWLSYVRGLRG